MYTNCATPLRFVAFHKSGIFLDSRATHFLRRLVPVGSWLVTGQSQYFVNPHTGVATKFFNRDFTKNPDRDQ